MSMPAKSIPEAGVHAARAAQQTDALPWWRYRMVWLVIGGPAVVVIASLVTAVIAHRGADELVDRGPAFERSAVVQPGSETPAMQARNHVQTSRPASPASAP